VAPAGAYSGTGYDLVTMFDCLHDMGDPVGAARHLRSTLGPEGTWMVVEPQAGDRIEENLNPVGRAYYAFSTLLCTPASLSQEVGLALGAQAGEARIRDVVEAGGFTRFRRAAETLFNLVFQARPLLETLSGGEMIEATAEGVGRGEDAADRRIEIELAYAEGGIASVTCWCHRHVDVLHLILMPDGWKIVNSAWSLR
jgi:hypothetical protein